MNKELLLVGMILLSSCAELSLTKSAYEYDLTPDSKVKDTRGALTVMDMEKKQINFQFRNLASTSAKIIWDDSVIVDTTGNVHKLIHNGVKLIKSGEAMAPTVVPATAFVSDAASYADGAHLYGSTWMLDDLVPCSGYGAICNHDDQYGKVLTLLLKVEQDGKQREYIAKLKLRKPASTSSQTAHTSTSSDQGPGM